MTSKLPDGIYIKDSTNMSEIEDETVTLIVTSPPYNVGKEYEKGESLDEWKDMMFRVLSECNRVMIDGGRACINISGIGRNPYQPRFCNIIHIASKIGWTMRGIILWIKGGSGPQTSWGSWCKATNPVLRDPNEFILVFHKGKENIEDGDSGITPLQFMEFTKAEWYFRPVRKTETSHPAPFPHELPRRCILLYSNIGDTVLDPFAGTCTTYQVAKYLHRNAIAYECNEDYIPEIQKRLQSKIWIQSKAYKQDTFLKKAYPKLYNMTTSELKKYAKDRYGIEIGAFDGKVTLIKKISKQTKRNTKLSKYL